MGHWVQGYDKAGVRNIFLRFYLMGIIGWFIVPLTSTHIKYYNIKKNNAKWLGALLGSLMGIVVWCFIVGIILFIDFVKILIIFNIGGILFLFTLLIYKRTIVEWEKQEKREKEELEKREKLEKNELLWKIGNSKRIVEGDTVTDIVEMEIIDGNKY